MQITEVKVFPIREEKLKAFVSVVFDGCFMVNDIKVIRGREGLFISMPSRKKKNGEFKDVAHPLNNPTRKMIEGEVLQEYERVLVERGLSDQLPGGRAFERGRDDAGAHAPRRREPQPPMAARPPRAEQPRAEGPRAERPRAEKPWAAANPSASGSDDRTQPPAPDPDDTAVGEMVPEPARSPSHSPMQQPLAAGPADAPGGVGAPGRAPENEQDDEQDKSLEEVQEAHLKDSFWTVG